MNFEVDFMDPISGLRFWIVAEVCILSLSAYRSPTQTELWAYCSDLRALDAQIKSTVKNLQSFKPLLSRLGPADAGAGMLLEFGKIISGVRNVTCHVHMLSDFK